MTAFAGRVAAVTGLPADRIELLAAGSLSEVLLLRWPDGRRSVAKSGPATRVEADMLRALAAAGAPAPAVEAVHDGLLLLDHVENDGAFTDRAWGDLGTRLRALHGCASSSYGWTSDYALGSVPLDNRQSSDWPRFWAEQRLVPTARLLDRHLAERVERLCERMADLLPASPPAALLHGDLWTGNILVRGGKLAGMIDPACHHGDAEVDLAMLDLFGSPGEAFHEAYGPLEPGWRERLPIYQLFPALVHLRLFGSGYAGMVERLLLRLGA